MTTYLLYNYKINEFCFITHGWLMAAVIRTNLYEFKNGWEMIDVWEEAE